MSQSNQINAYAALEAGGTLQPYSYDVGELAADEVEIEVLHCGICHSDVSMIDNEWEISEYPLVGGHEVIGKVVATGSNVQNLEKGTVVGVGWHSGYCGHCHSCKNGDQNLCRDAQGTIVAHHGGFAEKLRADAASVVVIPEGIDLKSAGPLLCAGITVFNPLVQFDVKSTDKVAVIGIGGLGHIALQFLNAWGCEVTAFTSSESKRQEALELGAHKTLNSRDKEEIKSAYGSFDFILSTVNVKLDWNTYVNTLKAKGRLHFVGATLEPLDLGVFPLIGGQKSVSGSPVGSPATMESMLEFAKLHDIKPQIESYPMEQINEALDHMKSGKARYRVVLSNG
ncbi:NAD(P)-dependent alcohol dehydrogenase [Verrucomicrobiaceae bacterium 5K15]|uniref:alcohol dehydrogenase (NADP(+)) n=1 Tax=Oceaniferula flava TaxID=2800421 RepID=A0AAE2SEW6_9BACT|nr:NAD(P)-dependent alcohol dehydrogenase [Oceaniferula flavus]MBK1856399.1 NAD(P)-dependent alcohol dehydrogenase [Oceaniferula flavus]MBM1137706.1 NAD(P)-dependent alcohol dehydrogenase [Oceaniferula flavus]